MRNILLRPSSAAALLALLAGCGGHGSRTASRAGHVSLTVAWPARGRYLPTAADRVVVKIMQGSEQVDGVTFVRNSTTGAYADTMINPRTLLEGGYTLVADAYTVSEDTKPLTHGEADVTVVAGKTTNQKVIMASQLNEFAMDLTDLVTGEQMPGVYISPTSASSTVTVRPSMVVGVAVHPASDKGFLVLYPPGAAAAPLRASGSLKLGSNTGTDAFVGGSFAPTAAASSGTLTMDFKDVSDKELLFEFSADMPVSITDLVPGERFTTSVGELGVTPACSSDGVFGVTNLDGTFFENHFQILGYANGDTTVIKDTGTAKPYRLAALPGALFYAMNSSVYRMTRNSDGTYGDAGSLGTGAIDFLTAASGKLYVARIDGASLKVSRYSPTTLSPLGPTTTLATGGTPTSFSVGLNPDGSEALYTTEGGEVQRYIGGERATFARKENGAYSSVAVDGNLVWASYRGTLDAYLASTGNRCGSYPIATGDSGDPTAGAGGGRVAIVTYGTMLHRSTVYTVDSYRY